MTDRRNPDSGLDRVLDGTLARALPPPQVPHAFRRRLEAALARSAETDLSQTRLQLERERHADLARLEDRYVRLRRRTLGTLIGAAFAAGATVTLALPWLQRQVGPDAPLVLTSAGAALGLAIAFFSWRAHVRDGMA